MTVITIFIEELYHKGNYQKDYLCIIDLMKTKSNTFAGSIDFKIQVNEYRKQADNYRIQLAKAISLYCEKFKDNTSLNLIEQELSIQFANGRL